MWWNIAPPMKDEFEDWHSHEHFPERLSIPGFLRSSRWTSVDGGGGVFVVYELKDHAVLSSPAYLASLNDPTPWSRKLMPHHKDLVRSQSHVLASKGSLVARHAMTLRLTPEPGRAGELVRGLEERVGALPDRPGLVGAHLLRHETPAIAQTTEQKIRGRPDQVADLVLVVTAYSAPPLEALAASELSDASLRSHGAAAEMARSVHTLSHSALGSDVR
jgi:hypothetical protein